MTRIEPCLMASWWYLTAIVRIVRRVPFAVPQSVDGLHLEPLVAGAPNPTGHNWGDRDPVVAGTRTVRIQIPVGFGASSGRTRCAMRSICGAVLPEDLAGARSLLAVLGAPMTAMRLWPLGADFAGIDLSAWSAAMRRRLCFSTTLQAAALVDAAVSALPGSVDRVGHASCWFENQPHERAFIQSVRSGFPGTRVVGFLLFHFSPCSHGGIVPTRLEVSRGAAPDTVLCCGAMQRDWLRSECPWISFESAPPGRFNLPDIVWDRSSRVALVMVPSSDSAAASMVRMVAEAARLAPPGWSFRVRMHPANGRLPRTAANAAGIPVDEFGPLESSLAQAGIVLGGGSSAIVLARSMGWPVIVLVPPGLPGMDPFPRGHRLDGVIVARSGEDVVDAMRVLASRLDPLEAVPDLFDERRHEANDPGSMVPQ